MAVVRLELNTQSNSKNAFLFKKPSCIFKFLGGNTKNISNFSLLGTFTTFSSKGIFTVFRSENALKETHFTV